MKNDDEIIKKAMGALREDDARRAPPFETMWRVPEKRGEVRRLRALPAAFATVAAAAAVALYFQTQSPSRPHASGSRPVAPAAVVVGSGPADDLALEFLLRTEPASGFAALVSFDSDPAIAPTRTFR